MENELKTRQDIQKLIIQLCESIKPCFSKGRALADMGAAGAYYGTRTILVESFARPLWGLAPLWAGGCDYDISDYYAEGFRNGPNPEHEEYWGEIGNWHQIMVEMAAMGLTLAIAPENVWEPLSDEEKERLAKWLNQINEYELPHNNWQFFNVLVNLGLKNVGMPYSLEKMDVAFDFVEKFYLGDGWYSDGIGTKQRDYYIPFAIHTYALIYAAIMKDEDPERCKKYIDRAVEFAGDFIYWFDEAGDALPFGRSLTYRFAQVSFWSALVLAGVEALPWGVIKGIILRNLRSWFAKPILNRDGILSVGYAYPNLFMSENYNSPGSPYWAFKAFLILAVPETHPFWQAEEAPLPELESIKELKHPYMVMMRPEPDNIIALTSGQIAGFNPTQNWEKYEKFAYSTYFGFSVSHTYADDAKAAPDSMLAFVDDGIIRVRKNCEEQKIEGNTIYSVWKPKSGITVKTWLTPEGGGHIRRHEIESDGEYTALECGFALPAFEDSDYRVDDSVDYSVVKNQYGFSGVKMRKGEGTPKWIYPEANTNLIHNKTIIPCVRYQINKGKTVIESFVIGLKDAERAKREFQYDGGL